MKVLLLTDMPPANNMTAGLVLEKLCRFFPVGSLAIFSVLPDWLKVDVPADLRVLPSCRVRRPQEKAFRPVPGLLGSATALARETFNAVGPTPKIAREAITFARDWGADAVWCILEGQTQIRLALPVSEGLGVPLFTQVWDPPGWWLRHNRIDPLTSSRILKSFDETMRASTACAAASWAMADEYERRYRTRCVAMPGGLDAASAIPPAEAPPDDGKLVIGMAGQLYADTEWNALIGALDSVGWRVAGRDVSIHLLGRYANLRAEGRANIRYLGWAAQEETIKLMAACDVLYAAYWFDKAYEEEARYSFPSKVTTYLAAGRPVLFHGPDYSSPARFLEEHSAGITCASLERSTIIDKLTALVSDKKLYAKIARNGARAFHDHLSLGAVRERFSAFLGIDTIIQ